MGKIAEYLNSKDITGWWFYSVSWSALASYMLYKMLFSPIDATALKFWSGLVMLLLMLFHFLTATIHYLKLIHKELKKNGKPGTKPK